MITPRPLHDGSRIAIISPATIVKGKYIDGAVDFLRENGFDPIVMPHAKGPADGTFAASPENRLADFIDAWTDLSVDAVLCARGGYGAAHLLPRLDPAMLRDNAKWLIGFSDISALHACLLTAGVKSIHGPMAKHLTEAPDHHSTRALMAILRGAQMNFRLNRNHPFNINGVAEGRMIGGNLAVLNGLASTPYDIFRIATDEDVILFIEDISEAIYAVERMLWRLYMAGTLNRIKGLVVGRFTEYLPDRNHPDMEHMIHALLERTGLTDIPVAYDFPVGHVVDNMPIIEGEKVRFSVTPDHVTVQSI